MAKKRVLGVVGMGHVGAHVAYALAIQGIADELVLVDQNEQKLASEVQDLRDAVAYMPHRVTVRGGDFSDLGVCDVIVNSVGKIDLLRGLPKLKVCVAYKLKNGETVTTRDFLRIGVPFTLAAVLAGYAYLWLVWGKV